MTDTKKENIREYLKYATNNLEALLADERGSRCVFCLGSPAITKSTMTVDESTVICPLCDVDAVIPASLVDDEAQLLRWHEEGFGRVTTLGVLPMYIGQNRQMQMWIATRPHQ